MKPDCKYVSAKVGSEATSGRFICADRGNIVAHYEYSPFGKLTATDGTMAAEFNHRFQHQVPGH